MDWVYLGHAGWHLEAAGLRLCFDPLLDDLHHGGVFTVVPPRRVDAAALRADYVLVSHRHPDHFDVRSLRRLAALDADTVVVTGDDLVARTCRRLGFRRVELVAPRQRIELDGVRLVTTPSSAPAVEWGVMVACDAGVAWNQVDTVLDGPGGVRALLSESGAALGLEPLELALAIVRWQPLCEVQATTGAAAGFPRAEYAAGLEQIAALGARALVPGAAGSCHAPPYAAMNGLVYPVSQARFLRDAAARVPGTRCLPATVGGRYRVAGGAVEHEPDGGRSLVEPLGPDVSPLFRPFELPALVDPDLGARREPEARALVAAWLRTALVPALARAYPALGCTRPLALALEVVFPSQVDGYTLRVAPGHATLEATLDPEYDVLDAVAGSHLCDVIEGRRHWGEPLLAGLLRSSVRAYEVDQGGLRALPIAPMFLYYGLSYAESVERATAWLLEHDD
ncbi:MAG: MBL fold metallo-hydrolase [Polyangiaceae bacterium]|nr:MBL fold metallo-hydrolase [Polyangiaceae bacterium]